MEILYIASGFILKKDINWKNVLETKINNVNQDN